jgi:hypothetical protein
LAYVAFFKILLGEVEQFPFLIQKVVLRIFATNLKFWLCFEAAASQSM